MSDLMHEPLAVHYSYESHALAGAIVGVALNEVFPRRWPKIARLGVATVGALAIGAGKEYLLDRHPNNREIWPWGAGAAAALAFRFSF